MDTETTILSLASSLHITLHDVTALKLFGKFSTTDQFVKFNMLGAMTYAARSCRQNN